MNDDLYPVPKWRIGELSTGLYSSEEILDLAQSFVSTESFDATVVFLDEVEDLVKTVDDVFELRPVSEEGLLSFLERSTQGNEVFHITNRLEVLYLAWQLASDLNPAVASFQGDTLQKLKAEIHLVNRDAINATCDGDPLQKLKAAMNSRRDITSAFYRLNRELAIHRAKYAQAERVSSEKGNKSILDKVAVGQDPPPPFLGLVFNHDSTVSRLGDDYKDKRTSVISLSPQQFKILKFIHDAGNKGRTKSEMDAEGFTSLKQEKTKINEKLIPLDLRFAIGEHKLIHIGNEQVTKLVTS